MQRSTSAYKLPATSRPARVVIPRLHDTTGCETGLTIGLITVLNEQPLFVQPVVKPVVKRV